MNKENKKKKRYTAILLLLLISVISYGIYGYWAGNVDDPNDVDENEVITIGRGENVNTKLDVTKQLQSAGKKLVPSGKTAVSVGGASQNVEEFIATYTVKWVEDGVADIITESDAIKGTLNVTNAGVTIGGQTTHAHLVGVDITPQSTELTADGQSVQIRVKVTLTEPANKQEYDAVAGKDISVDLKFSLAQ